MLFFVAIQVTCYIALQFPPLQTWLAKQIISSVQSNINGKINIDKVYIIFFNKIILKNVSIVSTASSAQLDSLKKFYNQSDTLVSCEKISLGLSASDLFKLKIKLTSINLQNGVFNLQNEGDSTTNLSRIFSSKTPKQKDTTASKSLDLIVNKLKIKNFRFTLNNPNKYVDKGDSIINFADLSVRDINVNINNIKLQNDTLFATVKNIAGTDKSGFKLAQLNCNLEVSGTEARFNNLIAADSYSHIDAKYFSMKYNSAKDLSQFTDKVILGANFTNTFLNFKTIGKIAPALKNSSLAFFVSGEAIGEVTNIRSKSLIITSESGETFVDIAVKLIGLPDIKETMANAKISSCYTTSNDISRIISSINNTPPPLFFKTLTPFVQYHFKGGFSGLLNDFVADGQINSSLGKINLDVLFKTESEKRGVTFRGHLSSINFNVGKLISNNIIGEVSLNTTFSALIRSENKGGTDLVIDNLSIDKLGLNGYDYSKIYAVGEYKNNDFDGRIICHDPNLDFIFQGLLSLNKKKNSKYDFYIDIPFANLAAMNIDKRDSVSEVNIRAEANFIKSPDGDIIGNINIKNSGYLNSKGVFNLGSIKLASHTSDSSFNMILTSPFANAKFDGTASFTTFIKKVTAITLYSKFNNFFHKANIDTILAQKDYYTLSAETFNTRGVCEFLLPGLYIQDSTKLNAVLDKDNNFNLQVKSGRLAVGENYLKDVSMYLKNNDSLINVNLFSRNIRVAGIKMDSTLIGISGGNNVINSSFDFKSDTALHNKANLNMSVEFLKDTVLHSLKKNVKIDINNSQILLKGEQWKFAPSNILIEDSTFQFNNIELYNGDQNIKINGVLSNTKENSLSVNLNKFNIGILNLFLSKSFDIEGYFSGKAEFSSLNKTPKLNLNITGDSVYVFHNPVGKMNIESKWDEPNRKLDIFINSILKNKPNLNINGFYKPDSTYLDVTASLNNLSVIYFEPFLSDIISKTNGEISGDLRLHGPLDKLKLEGENCFFTNFDFTVNFTQVPYRLNGPININENGIFVKDIAITDKYGSIGKVNGGLSYKYFKNINLNTRVDFENFQCINTREKDNEAFYGQAFASGYLIIQGPLNKLLLDINVQSDAKTSIHIPLSNAATANQTNLLTFKVPLLTSSQESYDNFMVRDIPVKQPTELNVQLKVNVTPQAEIAIEINKSVGDVIKASGNGLINMNINPNKEIFDVFGDYNISRGNYKFVLMGLASKDFIVQPGGTINFNGNIINTTLNLTAIYKTKASINTLIADTSSVSARRTVDCEIGMSGQLMNPQLLFNIQIPDLDPTTKVRVESALNTTGKIQKQFMALLVSGGFIPDEQSGIANNSTILYSNASEILSNQLNNIFQQLGIPLDLGLNYQPGDKGSNIFDVAVSTQLFNNRVLINGNIGNDPYANTNNRDVIGNIDIEVKLDKNGRLRLDLFSHAADKYSNYLDDKQRSGIGFGYQQEFNNFKEIFKKRTKEQKDYDREKKKRDKAHKEQEKALKKAAKQHELSR
ncbi:MAG: hypothetical protein RSF01_02520 [Bacteroidales bacterium]